MSIAASTRNAGVRNAQEISRNVRQAAVGTQDVSSNVGGVTQSVNATRTASESVTGQAQALRGDVESFLAKIRAA
jgi:methyl-accepting chemotaxis protein